MWAPLLPPVTRIPTMTPSPAERPPVSMAASPALSSLVTRVESEMAALFCSTIMMNVPGMKTFGNLIRSHHVCHFTQSSSF